MSILNTDLSTFKQNFDSLQANKEQYGEVHTDFVLINEAKIAEGIKYNFEQHKLITEGAAATSIMVVKDQLSIHLGENIVCLLCGSNIDSDLFSKIIR